MWVPLFIGEPRDTAVADIRAIAQAFASPSLQGQRAFPLGTEPDASLGSGTAGVALALATLADSGLVPRGRERALELLEASTAAMAAEEMDASLHSGYSGIAWSWSRICSPSDSAAEEDELSEIDSELATHLRETPWKRDYDLIGGLVGMGVYALERLPRPAARECLERIVDRLAETAERRDGGVTWFTPPSLLTEHQLRTNPSGYYNLGLAHGVPGVAGFLGQVWAAGVAVGKSRDLLDGVVAWLLVPERSGDGAFPYWTGPGAAPTRTRLAWCYGDPGVSAALLVAARCAGEPDWERRAVEIALRSAARPVSDAGVVDAGLCHGAAGLGHIYNRIWQRTRNEDVRRAAIAWLERTLALRHAGTGIGGYTTAVKNLDGHVTWEADPSFLAGAAGVALALAAAVSEVEPDWDRALLLSSAFER